MARLSVTDVWREAIGRVHAQAGVLFTIAAAFLLLPNLLMLQVFPELANGGLSVPRERVGVVVVPILLVALVQSFGQLAIVAVDTDGGRSTVGEALRRALAALPRLVGVMLATLALFLPLLLLLSLILAGVTAALGADQAASRRAVPIMLLPLIYIALRLLLVTPVVIAEPMGPIATLKRSWRLTQGATLPILGALLLGGLGFAGISLLVGLVGGAVTGVVARVFDAERLASFLMILLSTAATAAMITYLSVAVASIWRRQKARPAA